MTHEELVEAVRRRLHLGGLTGANADDARAVIALIAKATKEATEAMHDEARDWSVAKYAQGIGKDASEGCWSAMHRASALWPEEGK